MSSCAFCSTGIVNGSTWYALFHVAFGYGGGGAGVTGAAPGVRALPRPGRTVPPTVAFASADPVFLRKSRLVVMNTSGGCHPERSEGSARQRVKQVPRFARDDNTVYLS